MASLIMPVELDHNEQKIVWFGGGTGPFEGLRGLVKNHNPELITAITTTWDNGTDTGTQRTKEGVLGMGDYMRMLLAGMEDEAQFLHTFVLFNDRSEGSPFRNILGTRSEKLFHGAQEGIDALRASYRVRMQILLPSLVEVHLWSTTKFGNIEVGETTIDKRGDSIDYNPSDTTKRIHFDNPTIPSPKALEAVEQADKIIIGPGSPYTSCAPHLTVMGMREAIWNSRADLVIVGNLFTEKGESHHLNQLSRILALYQHYLEDEKYRAKTGRSRINYLLANENHMPSQMIKEYKEEGRSPVRVDVKKSQLQAPGMEVITKNFAYYDTSSHLLRHARDELAKTITELTPKQRFYTLKS